MSIPVSAITALGNIPPWGRVPTHAEEALIERLRAAILSINGKHAFEFGMFDPLRDALSARCIHCKQIVVAEKNPWDKPLIFGRSRWKPIRLSGLPTVFYCGYSCQWLSTFPDPDPYR